MGIRKINNSLIIFKDEPSIHIREYYNYCLSLIIAVLERHNPRLNVIFGNLPYVPKNENKIIRIDIQCEHTLVKEGGRGVQKKIFGNIPTDEGGKYLIRVDNFDYYNSLDFVIEYGFPNFKNITSSCEFKEYAKKILVIEPLIYPIDWSPNNRDGSFSILSYNERRYHMIKEFSHIDSNFLNVINCFSKDCLTELYKKYRIMMNIHQTEHHHTFEELRVLPALSQGVLIISEDVPLKESIPYHEYIIWSKYNDLPKTLLKVMNDYNNYSNMVFNKELKKTLENIIFKNKTEIEKIMS